MIVILVQQRLGRVLRSGLRTSVSLLRADPSGLAEAGARIRDGQLVAFPTETVWGLGANALNADAVDLIFKAKKRPRTNPLIVHVSDKKYAIPLGRYRSDEFKMFNILTDKFWPGPFTLIVRASPLVPHAVTAGTAFVGLRCPGHPLAARFLEACGVPVAAPSANLSGRISPTKAQHVMDDFKDHDISIIDNTEGNTDWDFSCEHGIESTVAKIDFDNKSILILREGTITRVDISKCLSASELSDWRVSVAYHNCTPPAICDGDGSNAATETEAAVSVSAESPGLSLTHYAPARLTYMVSSVVLDAVISADRGASNQLDRAMLSRAVVIDYGQRLKLLESHVLAYRDMSVQEEPIEAARALFETLRWADAIQGGEVILVADATRSRSGDRDVSMEDGYIDSVAPAIADRMMRACSGMKYQVFL